MNTKNRIVLKQNEREMFFALYRTGVMRRKSAIEHLNVSEYRIRKLIKEGYVEVGLGNLLYLTKLGTYLIEKRDVAQYPYRNYGSLHYKHNLILSEIYLSLSETERNSWKTDTQIREELFNNPEHRSIYEELKALEWKDPDRVNFMPDGAYFSDSEDCYVAVEVATDNYSQQDMEQKQIFAQIFYDGKFHGGGVFRINRFAKKGTAPKIIMPNISMPNVTLPKKAKKKMYDSKDDQMIIIETPINKERTLSDDELIEFFNPKILGSDPKE